MSTQHGGEGLAHDGASDSDSTARGDGQAGRLFEVWAPAALERVDLVLDGAELPMERGEGGWWRLTAPARQGARYAYRLDGGPPRPDPRSPRQPDGVHLASAVHDPWLFKWSQAHREWPGVDLEGQVIYELHVGTFTEAGTLDAAVERLGHLVDLGVTMVELLPVASFPGRHGWGYDGVALYSVHEPYGGPEALQRFVDAAHQRGLAVCLDVVYNHLGPSGNYLGEFGPYFTSAYSTPWGLAVNLDGPGSDEVRAFITGSVARWLTDFGVDALRLDAVHELHDRSATPILETLARCADEIGEALGRPVWLIAESDRNDPRTVMPYGDDADPTGGLGIDAQWADDIHHAWHAALTGETAGYYADFAAEGVLERSLTSPFLHDGRYSSFRGRHHGRPVPAHLPGWRFVASLQTHDQVGNRWNGARLGHLTTPGRAAIGAALLLTAPWTPMLWMGEEWGASTPWMFFTDHEEPELAEAIRRGRRAEFAAHGWGQDIEVPDPQSPSTQADSRLRWSEVDDPGHAQMLDWYRRLIALRAQRVDLRSGDRSQVAAHHDAKTGVLVVRRGAHAVVACLGTEQAEVRLPGGEGLRGLAAWGRVGLAAAPGEGLRLSLGPDSVVVLGPEAP